MFSGAITAMVTPFKNGKVDYDAAEKQIEFQIKEGINGLVPCGSTGESATMSHNEHKEFIKFCIQKVNKRVPVIAGTGSNNTAEAIELTRYAEEIGADGALLISPYYNKPTQEGLYQHYKAIADNVKSLPILIYNVPGRTSKNVEASTVEKLSTVKNIAGIKEASANLEQMTQIIYSTPEKFVLLSGDDSLTIPIYSVGGRGVISVLSNILPGKVAKLCALAAAGKYDEANKLNRELLPLANAMFIETNPIPVKEAMGMLGMCSAELRLPLTPMSEENKKKLHAILKQHGLL